MKNAGLQNLLQKEMTRKQFLGLGAIAIASLFGVAGVARQLLSHAANPYASTEPETGTATGPATVVTDSTASGGKSIKFGTATTSGGGTRDAITWPYMPTPTTSVGVTGSAASQYPDFNAPTTQQVQMTAAAGWTNKTVEGMTVYGELVSQTSGITFKNCILRGPRSTPANETGVINCHSTANDNLTVIDCTIAPQWPNQNLSGIEGHRYKAIRTHLFWVVDGFGAFNASGTRDSMVEISGCRVEQLTYYHGGFYCNRNGKDYMLQPDGSYTSNATTAVKRPADAWTDKVHADGNHSDSIEIQGGYGFNTENADGTWSGTGINLYHNYFRTNLARPNSADPSGLGLPVPGTSAGLSGSKLGTHDSPKVTAQTPSMTVPIATPGYATAAYFDGEWPAVGSTIIAVQNLNQFPYPTAAEPTKWTITVWENLLDDAGIGLNVQAKNYATVAMVFLRNQFTRNVYRYNASSIYAMDFPKRSSIKIRGITLGKDFNTVGTNTTNVWKDTTNTFGPNGSALFETKPTASASTSGIVFRAD